MVNNDRWYVRAGGNRFRHVSGYRAAEIIEGLFDGEPLTDSQKSALTDTFCDNHLRRNACQVLEWEPLPKDETGGFLWRLSLPLLYVWLIVFYFVICSIKWLFTGVRSFGRDSWVVVFNSRWIDNAFGR